MLTSQRHLTVFCSCTGLLYWMGSVLFDVKWVEDSKGKQPEHRLDVALDLLY